ncbi:sugar transferase [Saccharopolyspora gloriosae]|uniref:sugar transferase n=1 Tax=Saccharopolyspora gloriosae TaxID=455344 RepID=UPI001FB85621|nr:sugar transferase [Saccharopolyspora gloriosae]
MRTGVRGAPRLLPVVLWPVVDAVTVTVAALAVGTPGLPGALYVVAVLGVLAAGGGHRLRVCLRVGDQVPRLVLAAAVPAALLVPWTGDGWLVPAGASALVLARGAGNAGLRAAHRRGLLVEQVLIVGAGSVGVRISRALREHPEFGLRPAFLADGPAADGTPVLGRPHRLGELVARHRVTRVILCAGDTDADLVSIVRACRPLPADVYLVPGLPELGVAVPQRFLDEIWGVPLVPLRRWAHTGAAVRAKRIFDVVLAGALLVVLAPLLLALAAAVRLGGGGAALFRQRRVTGAGRSATVVKLRTIPGGTEQGWSVPAADTTGLSRWLRGTHFDELPQLSNVLRGEMSVVGPRPERPCYAERFAREIPRYRDRHRVRGGMTGWAQVHGLHGDTSIPERADFDNRYIENWTPWLDVVVVARTVGIVLATAMGEDRNEGSARDHRSGGRWRRAAAALDPAAHPARFGGARALQPG